MNDCYPVGGGILKVTGNLSIAKFQAECVCNVKQLSTDCEMNWFSFSICFFPFAKMHVVCAPAAVEIENHDKKLALVFLIAKLKTQNRNQKPKLKWRT